MSSFIKQTRHPITGKWQEAIWIDDYFGHRNYGVAFKNEDGKQTIFDARKYEFETREISGDGKEVKKTHHADGRKDVRIEVNMLDVNENDPATKKAKEVIEKEVIPKLANKVVTAVLVHTPTHLSTSTKIKLPRVREWAEFAIGTLKSGAIANPRKEDFIVVEVDHDTGDARVTKLV